MAYVEMHNWGSLGWGGLVTDSGSETWRFSDPGVTDTIVWSSGPNMLEGIALPAKPTITEGKFNFRGAVPRARTLRGMRYIDRAPGGSWCRTVGSGRSGKVGAVFGRFNWKCSWSLSMTVTRGNAPNRDYACEAEADDPTSFTAAHFADAQEGRFSLYVPVTLSGLDTGSAARGGWSVAMTTDAGRVELLRIDADASGVAVSGDDPDGLEVYVVARPYDDPRALGQPPISAAALRDQLSARFDEGQQSGDITLGILYPRFEVPTVEIAPDGVVATLHTATHLAESGSGRDTGETEDRDAPEEPYVETMAG